MTEPKVIIYQPSRSITQSGKAKNKSWIMESTDKNYHLDEFTKWIGNINPEQQIKLSFSSEREACAFAKSKNLDFEIVHKDSKTQTSRSHSNNFK